MENCLMVKRCGSCQFIGMPYLNQLEEKKKYCMSLIKNSSVSHIKVNNVIGMDNPFHYRNKVIVAFNQKYEYGLYEEHSHKIIPYQSCALHDKEIDAIIHKIQSLFKKYRVSIYDEKKQYGLVKHLLVRRAIKTNQTMVVLVCSDSVFTGSKNFCQELIKQFPSIKTVVLNINRRKTNIVLGTEEKILYGKGFIVDELNKLTFKISSTSFYQINHDQCEQLYQKVISLLSLSGTEMVIDTYCGIGTIGMLMAKSAYKVIGVERNKEAIQDAITNARHNKIENISFANEDATTYISTLAAQHHKIDIVIMDPPRSGSTKEFIESLGKINPSQIVYISCEPATQIRDLEDFKKLGYHTKQMYLFDMFPQTKHVESIVVLTKE